MSKLVLSFKFVIRINHICVLGDANKNNYCRYKSFFLMKQVVVIADIFSLQISYTAGLK